MSVKGNHFAELWADTVPPEVPCPQPLDPEDMVRLVNAALDVLPSERRQHMRQKTRFAAVFIAAVVALVGTTLAVTVHWDVLDTYFKGDTSSAKPLVDHEVRSVSDKDYALTVESSVSDSTTALLLVRVDALTEESRAFMFSDNFNSMDTWSIYPLLPEENDGDDASTPSSWGVGYSDLRELRTESSTFWRFDVDLAGATALRVRLGYMEEGAALEFDLTPAESVTVDIGATGPGAPTLDNARGGDITVHSVTLSPLTCQVKATIADPDEEADPLLFFLMEDGTLITSGQSLTSVSAQRIQGERWSFHYRFQSVMDLSQLAAVVFDGTAYPLDGGEPYAVEVDPKLYPFQIPLMDPITEEGGYALPVEDLCLALDASYEWKEDTQTAACTYRDTTIVLTVGSSTALVDGEPVDLGEPVVLRDGILGVSWKLSELWGLDATAAYNETQTERTYWVVIP